MKEKAIIIMTSLGLTAFAAKIFAEFLQKKNRRPIDYLTLSYTTSAVLRWIEFMLKTGYKIMMNTEN